MEHLFFLFPIFFCNICLRCFIIHLMWKMVSYNRPLPSSLPLPPHLNTLIPHSHPKTAPSHTLQHGPMDLISHILYKLPHDSFLMSVGRLIGRVVCLSCHTFQVRTVTLPCSYRSSCLCLISLICEGWVSRGSDLRGDAQLPPLREQDRAGPGSHAGKLEGIKKSYLWDPTTWNVNRLTTYAG